MFTFNPAPKFTALVEVREPGSADVQTFTGHFTALSQTETERLQGPEVPREKIAQANEEWLARIFTGWGEDLAVDGKPLPVTDENRRMLMAAPWVRAAVTRTYLAEIAGAARKN